MYKAFLIYISIFFYIYSVLLDTTVETLILDSNLAVFPLYIVAKCEKKIN